MSGADRNPPPPAYAGELARELGHVVRGEVDFGPGARALYAYDASIFRQVPVGVVTPRDADDVAAALAACRTRGAPVLGRGCGTALAGQTVNEAVVFDFSRHMNALVGLDPGRRQARVQPGLICDGLRDAAEEHQLTFGPDPATHDHATLGGMIGNNSCGTHSVLAALYGTGPRTSDNIDELEVITYDGLRMRVGATSERELRNIIAAGGRRAEIYAGLKRIADTYADAIRGGLPDIPRRVSGYNIDELLPEKGFNVARALVGSEGTCALVLEATAHLVHSPPERSLVVLGYPDIPSSGDDVPWLMGFEPIGCEFTSRHVVDNLNAKGFNFGGEERMPPGNAWVLLEFGGDTKDEADGKAEDLFRALEKRDNAPSHRLYKSPEDETAVWEIRRHSAGTARMPAGLGGHGGWPNWEDAAVPPERLGDYLREFTGLLDKHGYDGVFYGHWGQGCVHCRIDWDFRTAGGVRKYRTFMEEAADAVVSYGGSLSGEHGDGHGRAELWPKMFSPELMRAFADFKAVWDPDNKMNPHKLVDPYPLDEHLREGTSYRPLPLATEFGYPEDGGSFHEAVGRCFGVGKCRHTDGGVMCPSFMVTGEEQHSTRGRARLLQEMAEASGPVKDRWRSEEVKEALDLCLACKGCKGDCPVKVDMATYKAEFLHHYYEGRPWARPRQAYALGLIPVWARLASHAPGLANFASHAPLLGNAVKLAGGVAQRRSAPKFAAQTFTAWFRGHVPRDESAPVVLLWPDTFTNYFEPDVGKAAVEVLEAAGFRVTLPEGNVCCGRPLYDYGMLGPARRYLLRTLDTLRPQIEAGVPVVGLEPSCLAVFRDELVNMLPGHLDAQRLKKQSYVLSEFLTIRAPGFVAPRLERTALVQPHCHHHAVMGFDAEKQLLTSLGLDVQMPDTGCCGMAGAPVIKAQLGKDCIPDDSPYTTGSIALVGTRPSEEAFEQCDALLIVGSTMPYIEFYPKPGQAVCVQVDDKPERIGLRYPVDVPLVGDARATLAELLPLLARNENRDFLTQAQDGMKDWWALMEERGTRRDTPMKPQVPAWSLNDVLAGDAIICGDSGTVTTWAARQIKVRRGQQFSFSGTNCSMAAGLPYAIGAAAAYPGRQVVVFTGDGSLTMQLGDFLTAVQHDLPIKIVVVKNNTLGLIKWEQMVFLGNAEYGVNMAPLDFVKFAEAAGGRGMHIADPASCAEQMREAFSWDGPVIIECLVDQHEPPMPAKVKKQQVTKMAQALREGTPNRNRIALQMVKDLLDESTFDASPGHVIPGKLGEAVSGLAGRLRDMADDEHPE